jgi:hypothetical protein
MNEVNATARRKPRRTPLPIAAANDSRSLTAEAVRNDKSFGMREDSQAEISCLHKKLMSLQKN